MANLLFHYRTRREEQTVLFPEFPTWALAQNTSRIHLKVQLNAGNNYSPDIIAEPCEGPDEPWAHSWARQWSLPGPFHSGSVVVSRVHRPPEEAFHSCFGTRNTFVAASERKSRKETDRGFFFAEKHPGGPLATWRRPPATTTGRWWRSTNPPGTPSTPASASCIKHVVLRHCLADALNAHPGIQWSCTGAFFCLLCSLFFFFHRCFYPCIRTLFLFLKLHATR